MQPEIAFILHRRDLPSAIFMHACFYRRSKARAAVAMSVVGRLIYEPSCQWMDACFAMDGRVYCDCGKELWFVIVYRIDPGKSSIGNLRKFAGFMVLCGLKWLMFLVMFQIFSRIVSICG